MKTNQERINELTSPIARQLCQNLQDELKHCFEFGGKSIHEMEQAAIVERQEMSDHQQKKITKADRLMSYGEQWDAEEQIDYIEDGPKLHQNSVLFLKLVLSEDEFEKFEDECLAHEKEIA